MTGHGDLMINEKKAFGEYPYLWCTRIFRIFRRTRQF